MGSWSGHNGHETQGEIGLSTDRPTHKDMGVRGVPRLLREVVDSSGLFVIEEIQGSLQQQIHVLDQVAELRGGR